MITATCFIFALLSLWFHNGFAFFGWLAAGVSQLQVTSLIWDRSKTKGSKK
jgi:heme exporter protein D